MSEISLGFLGSGEFDPWSEPVERWLLARSPEPGRARARLRDRVRARG